MAPSKTIPYRLPVLKVVEVVPALERGGIVYGRRIKVHDRIKKSFILLERSRIAVEKYMGRPMECIAEIVKARFFGPGNNDLPPETLAGTFLGTYSCYKFFAPLVDMVDNSRIFDSDEYDHLATGLFSGWGVSGFVPGVHVYKPMIRIGQAVFLLNEYLFEEEIELWTEELPKVPVQLCIDELLLHGIKLASDEDAEEFERWYQETLRKDARMKKKLEELQINKNHNSNTGAMSEKWDEDIPEI